MTGRDAPPAGRVRHRRAAGLVPLPYGLRLGLDELRARLAEQAAHGPSPERLRRVLRPGAGGLALARRLLGAARRPAAVLVSAAAGAPVTDPGVAEAARRSRAWLEASTEITRLMLAGAGGEPLALVARRARELAAADLAAIVLPSSAPDRLLVEVADGTGADTIIGLVLPADCSLARAVMCGREAVLVEGAAAIPGACARDRVDLGPAMLLPLVAAGRAIGALVIGRRHGRPAFGAEELEMGAGFAHHAALALELARSQAREQRVALLEERDRIARDLHDLVIQRILGAGFGLQRLATRCAQRELTRELLVFVDDLDTTIREIRATIFALHMPSALDAVGLRARVLAATNEAADPLGFEPHVRLEGPIDGTVPDDTAAELLAVLREALSNVARHARATRVEVHLRAQAGASLTLLVTDNGDGLATPTRSSGLANMAERAARLGGTFRTTSGAGAGTAVEWCVPLPAISPAGAGTGPGRAGRARRAR